MIKKLKVKFITTAMIAIAVLLFAILATINITNFALVTSDADKVLSMLTENAGGFGMPPMQEGEMAPRGGRDQMGPAAPDTQASMRFFTFAFDESGSAREIRFEMSAMSRDDALDLAASLRNKTKGWVNVTYRYAVYEKNGETYITVVDQARELLPSYRVLAASVIGSAAGLLISLLVLIVLSEQFVKPLSDSDKKQKLFISEASREMKTPLTVLALDKDRLKEEFGENDTTKSMDRQTEKLFGITLKLNELLVFEQSQIDKKDFDFSRTVSTSVSHFETLAQKQGLRFDSSIESGIIYRGEEGMMSKLLFEVFDNAVKFGKTYASVSLKHNGNRVLLTVENDAQNLPEGLRGGDYDRVFERFYKSPAESEGKGLGLSIAKEIVTLHGGRIKAQAVDGVFTLKIEL